MRPPARRPCKHERRGLCNRRLYSSDQQFALGGYCNIYRFEDPSDSALPGEAGRRVKILGPSLPQSLELDGQMKPCRDCGQSREVEPDSCSLWSKTRFGLLSLCLPSELKGQAVLDGLGRPDDWGPALKGDESSMSLSNRCFTVFNVLTSHQIITLRSLCIVHGDVHILWRLNGV
jgi:hypothetical protein